MLFIAVPTQASKYISKLLSAVVNNTIQNSFLWSCDIP